MFFVDFFDESFFKTNYLSNLNEYYENCKYNSLYEDINFATNRKYLNFINQKNNEIFDKTTKKIIEKQLLKLENVSSGLGDIFLEKIIEYHNCKDMNKVLDMWEQGVERFSLSHAKEFITKNIYNEESKILCNSILDNSPAGSSFFIEKSNRKKSLLNISQKITFKLKFDTEMIIGSKWHRMESNILLIDGFIDSLGEIHHLLQKASENKNPYLIICKGMRDDVKNTIVHNLMRGTIDIAAISLETNEENVNILNDIAACCGSDIVSAMKGDTISNFTKNDLKIIKNVEIKKDCLSFRLPKDNSLNIQKKFLIDKKNSLPNNDPNFEYLSKRIKNLSSKRVDIYMKSDAKAENKIDIDYFLKFLISGKTGVIKCKKSKKLFTFRDAYLFKNILTSTINILDNIGGCLVVSEDICQ